MLDFSSMVQVAADVLMIVGGTMIFVQNYRYWQKYRVRDSVYWFVAGASAVFLGCWVLVTRFFLPASLDIHAAELLEMSRRILYVIVFLYFVGVGFWEYVLKK